MRSRASRMCAHAMMADISAASALSAHPPAWSAARRAQLASDWRAFASLSLLLVGSMRLRRLSPKRHATAGTLRIPASSSLGISHAATGASRRLSSIRQSLRSGGTLTSSGAPSRRRLACLPFTSGQVLVEVRGDLALDSRTQRPQQQAEIDLDVNAVVADGERAGGAGALEAQNVSVPFVGTAEIVLQSPGDGLRELLGFCHAEVVVPPNDDGGHRLSLLPP